MTEFALAVSMNPGESRYYQNLGLMQMATGNWSSARKTFEKASRIDHKNPEPPFHLGLVLIKEKKYRSALAAFEESTRRSPEKRDAYYYSGQVHFRLKNYMKAAQAWQKAAQIKTNHDLEINIGRAYLQADALDLARRHLNNARIIEESSCDYLFYSGRLADKDNKRSQANELYKKTIQCMPENPMPYYHLGKNEMADNPDQKASENPNIQKFFALTKHKPE